MSWLSSFLHPGRGYKESQKEQEKYYNEAQGYNQPYNENGVTQGKNLTGYIDELTNPEELHNKWVQSYKESEAAKQLEGIATEHGLDSASSMGLMGSTPALQAIQAGTAGIVAQDRQNYLNDLMEKYKTGVNASQGVYNTGAGAAGRMSDTATGMGETSGKNKFGETNSGGESFGKVGGMLAKLVADYMTGGMGHGSFGRGAWSTGGS